MAEKSVYMVLLSTGTIPAKAIRFVTGDEYSHASICLDDRLDTMYSFSRKYTCSPFPGGFMMETPDTGVLSKFPDSKMALLKFDVNEDTHERIKERLEVMYSEKKKYNYNYIGALMTLVNKNLKRKYKFYCSEFVDAIFTEYGIYTKQDMPGAKRPMDFYKAFGDRVVYEGALDKYLAMKKKTSGSEEALIEKKDQ